MGLAQRQSHTFHIINIVLIFLCEILLFKNAGCGTWTHTVSHKNLNLARLPIPPIPLIKTLILHISQFCHIHWLYYISLKTISCQLFFGTTFLPLNKKQLHQVAGIRKLSHWNNELPLPDDKSTQTQPQVQRYHIYSHRFHFQSCKPASVSTVSHYRK